MIDCRYWSPMLNFTRDSQHYRLKCQRMECLRSAARALGHRLGRSSWLGAWGQLVQLHSRTPWVSYGAPCSRDGW